jgi:single-strand DNA-binding protein
MNSVNMIGRLSKNPEVRYISNDNKPVCSFSIALDDGFGNSKKTYFFNCTAWNKTAENVAKYFKKGDLIGITGKLTQRSWEKDGKKNTVVEILVEGFSFWGTRN